ncbi:exopolysaccharide biosynthesis protein, acetyltransferase [Streptococcus pneumoniae]|nr:exopolysaccharide biosynthesis protein, acetyltransferase [Streptococcus pneumoniae]
MKKNHLVGDALILTVSDQIEELDYLLESLPNICFYIAAPVQFSEKIRSLETNYNVRLRTITRVFVFMITTIFILLKRLKSGSGLQRRLELAETAG